MNNKGHISSALPNLLPLTAVAKDRSFSVGKGFETNKQNCFLWFSFKESRVPLYPHQPDSKEFVEHSLPAVFLSILVYTL